MNVMKKIALFFPLMIGVSTFADGMPASQSLHQAGSGVFELTPSVGLGSMKYNYGSGNGNSSSSTTSLFGLNLMGEYGINEMISVGLRIGYQKDNYSFNGKNGNSPSSNAKGDGMVDPDLFINFRNDVGVGFLRYGANLSFSLADQNGGDALNSLNEYTGGLTFAPYIGWEVPFGKHELGVRFSYDLVQTDRNVDASGVKGKIKNGNEFTGTVFYEYNLSPVVVGADVGFMSYASTDISGFASSGQPDQSTNNSYSAGKIDIYAAYAFAKDFVLIPEVGYNTLDTGAQWGRIYNPGTSSSGGGYVDLALRMGF